MNFSINAWLVGFAALGYLALLFFIAYWAEDQAKQGRWLGQQLKTSPIIYTLSIAVYCTSWTFFGAVGTATKSGLEFVAIYLGPSIVFFGWLFLVRKLARISRIERVTSIADFLSSRYGKSQRIGVLVTVVALVATTPYIALQLKAVGQSIEVLTNTPSPGGSIPAAFDVPLIVAVVIGLFTLLFGTRHLNANERHTGIVAAIAFESLVKLFAFVSIGVFVVWGLNGSPWLLLDQMSATTDLQHVFTLEQSQYGRWMTLLLVSAIAAICLPRQFQVTVVENEHGDHLRAASWMFPLYLFVLCLFVIPIAWTGLAVLPAGSDPDMFVLTLPLSNGNTGLALLAFIGGFSSATSMMIIASIVLALMICNHIIVPVLIRTGFLDSEQSEDQFARSVLNVRRLGILVVLGLGYAYLRLTDETTALASIGLISFVGAAQFLPAILFGVFWRRSSKTAAFWAILTGTVIWAYTLLLPALERSGLPLNLLDTPLLFLHPEGLLGQSQWDPLAHSLFFSLLLNCCVLWIVSVIYEPKEIERDQAHKFVDVFAVDTTKLKPATVRTAPLAALQDLAIRFLGKTETKALFKSQFLHDGKTAALEPPTIAQSNKLLSQVETSLAANLGSASARVIVNRLAQAQPISADEAIQILDEAQQLAQYSAKLEQQQIQLEQAAKELADANDQLKLIDKNKDEFLRQVSHELRTPLTSVRSFAEIMETTPDLPPERRERFLTIIRKETERLTRLLEGILVQRRGHLGASSTPNQEFNPSDIMRQCEVLLEASVIDHAITMQVQYDGEERMIFGDPDALQQALLNILTNAIKFSNVQNPVVAVTSHFDDSVWSVHIRDNGAGFGDVDFASAVLPSHKGRWLGAGVGLKVTHEIVASMNGELKIWDECGAHVELTLPVVN